MNMALALATDNVTRYLFTFVMIHIKRKSTAGAIS